MKIIHLKLLGLIVLCVFTMKNSHGQTNKIDSLRYLLESSLIDTNKVDLLFEIGIEFKNSNPDLFLESMQDALMLSNKIGYAKGEFECRVAMLNYWWVIGDYSTALKITLPMINFVEKHKNDWYGTFTYISLASIYRDIGVYPQALEYAYHSLSFEQLSQTNNYGNLTNAVVASIFYEMNNIDSAMAYIQKSKSSRRLLGDNGWALTTAGRVYTKANQIDSAYIYYHLAINELKRENNKKDLAGTYNSLATLFHETGNSDSAFIYVQNGIKIAQKDLLAKELYNSYLILSSIYEKKNSDSALFYLKSAFTVNEKLYGQEKVEQLVSYKFNEDLQKQEIKATEQQYKNKIRIYGLLVLAGVFLMLVAIMIIRNKQKGKLTRMLQKQKEEIQNQNKELNQTLTKLKSTQAQLIQQEKLASLGQLTAGIAHEIQNPLNFVNNFSEVNGELALELVDAAAIGDVNEVQSLAKIILENERKIASHGKRADGIVKSMLQHSQAGSGQKEFADINTLCDECLRLAYHGFRAKDKSLPIGQTGFNTVFETNFDPTLPKVSVVPQDIAKVLLNLISNAFYAINEKGKSQLNGYKPSITVATKNLRGKIEITVQDNGIGIPQKLLDKIFQPFFTTKPTGQGTGLGLSLSYDIIKAHGGELKAETKEGEGSEFLITLPSASKT